MRLDKWLWQARFVKSRSISAELVGGGHVRVNSQKVSKSAHAVGPGDVLTFAYGGQVRVIRIEALGTRRGPASEAQALYTDLEPPQPKEEVPTIARIEGNSRPTKRERRKLDLDRLRALE
ncbi:RNA-binding S4 domain-containing protein [Pseudooceanicola nanhaiensis]|uniref:RNA-binding S4 domain-containing protein n=1 Tax=Pseudooceanicola nanhaiensis TaxID=375761 RepID=UPI001CD6DB29|nr:RNA-binding S4 domain-containing protein [Pseudooceanicola nanhaiensis]MCA0919615.1 RNA-binding S4 domain-containing protein [Pseudooceanicola nanhaiensis]